MQQETVIVLDFGGQYNQLIARRVRECNVYCEIYSYRTDLAKIKAKNPKGIIFTGGPNSAYLPVVRSFCIDFQSFVSIIYHMWVQKAPSGRGLRR